MKARVFVLLSKKRRPWIRRAQSIGHALNNLGFASVGDVRQGKLIEIELAESDEAKARADIKDVRQALGNTVLEKSDRIKAEGECVMRILAGTGIGLAVGVRSGPARKTPCAGTRGARPKVMELSGAKQALRPTTTRTGHHAGQLRQSSPNSTMPRPTDIRNGGGRVHAAKPGDDRGHARSMARLFSESDLKASSPFTIPDAGQHFTVELPP